MIRCSCTQSSGLDKRELYAYVAGCPCYIWASTCVLGYVLHFRPTKTQVSLCRLASDFVTNIHKVWMKIKTRNKIWTSIVQLDASTVLNWPTQRHLSRWHAPINKFRHVQSNPWPVDLTRCMLGYFLCSLSAADFTWSGSKLFTKIISRRHLYMYIKSVVRRPYQLAPRTVKITFMV